MFAGSLVEKNGDSLEDQTQAVWLGSLGLQPTAVVICSTQDAHNQSVPCGEPDTECDLNTPSLANEWAAALCAASWGHLGTESPH